MDRNFFYLIDDSVLVTKISVSSVCNGPIKETVVLRAKTLKLQSMTRNQNQKPKTRNPKGPQPWFVKQHHKNQAVVESNIFVLGSNIIKIMQVVKQKVGLGGNTIKSMQLFKAKTGLVKQTH